MLELFFGDKTVIFADRGGTAGFSDVPEREAIDLRPGERIGIAKMLEKLENNKTVAVVSAEPRRAFEDFASEFVRVEAAGGAVRDGKGNLLMIFRNGRWDLPKGHVESGEETGTAALREVAEETGITDVRVTGLIAETLHFYLMYGRWELKRTSWYGMTGSGDALSPQTEEGITRVEWVPPGKVREYAATAFASIRKVLDAIAGSI